VWAAAVHQAPVEIFLIRAHERSWVSGFPASEVNRFGMHAASSI